MTPQTFVSSIKVAVAENAAKGVISQLAAPAGRNPSEAVLELSEKFRALTDEQRDFVVQIAEMAADQAAYNFLGILDGIIAVESVEAKGELKLVFETDTGSDWLNDPDQVELTYAYKGLE
jgi:hypothetical protein